MRTVSVSLYGAWINDESKKPIAILNSVPSYVYNLEVGTHYSSKNSILKYTFRSADLSNK